MSTIRRRMTQRLLLLWTGLIAIGACIAYIVTLTTLTRQFDNSLLTKAAALASHIEQDNGRVELEISPEFLNEFDAEGSAFYQVCRQNGEAILQSNSLHKQILAFDSMTARGVEHWSARLRSGLPVRIVSMPFRPILANEHARTDQGSQTLVETGWVLLLAAERRSLDRTLSMLAMVLAGSGILMLSLTAATVPWLLRHEMKPLDRLALQAQGISATSLNERFQINGLPGELIPVATRLNELLHRLQSSFDRERQLSDDIAHELRTPIAEIRSIVELSLKWPDVHNSDSDRSVLAISLQMETMVCRLLTIARSDASPLKLAKDRIILAAFVTSICNTYQSMAIDRNIIIDNTIPSSMVINSDEVTLRSIVSNLIANAVEYSINTGVISIRCEIQNDRFCLLITNPVQSLKREDVPHLFERFWRKDPARSGANHLGLGLSLAKALATNLGFTLTSSLDTTGQLTMQLSGASEASAPCSTFLPFTTKETLQDE